MTHKQTGNAGEKEVCEKIVCPNCASTFVLLPESFPLADVQCSRCVFRAQVKTSSHAPSDSVRGAGFDIYDKVVKAGYLAPPLIVNFKWASRGVGHQEIRFYPFIGKENVKKYVLAPTAKRANYKMFCYVGLQKLPHFVLYPNEEEDKK